MKLHELQPDPGSTKPRTRRGRGNGSGLGTFSGRGMKGQNARSGGGVRRGFEGGQSSFLQKMPKRRGFTNYNRVEFAPVNLNLLEAQFADGDTVNPASLKEKRIVRQNATHIKILAHGDLTKKLSFEDVAFSGSAKEKIEKAGGKITEAKEAPKAEKTEKKEK